MGAHYKAPRHLQAAVADFSLSVKKSRKHLNGRREYHNGDDVLTIISNRSQARTSTLRIAHTILVVFMVAEDQSPVYLSS